ncbi:unnamed protein product [Caenorhabditis sp. 36 PRJEB53466]|nr:unnamed protein product [Caenorhabditis sp. 36 PRJEB53466]
MKIMISVVGMLVRLFLLVCSFHKLALGSDALIRRSVFPFLGAGGSVPTGMLIKRELWHCGSDRTTGNISYNNAAKDCPSLAAAINHCCAIHDDCYGQQAGQEKCDRDFCECNRMVTRLPTEEGFKCRGAGVDACLILEFFGAFAYGNSNYSDPTKPSGNVLSIPKSVPNLDKTYLDLYATCPFVNITLASCAVNFDLCAVVHSSDFCANDLCHCMLDAAESDPIHKHQCLESVAHMCRIVLKHSTEALTSRTITKKIFMMAVLVLAAASTGCCLFFMYTKASNDKKRRDENKYLHIHTVESSRSMNPLLYNTD